MPPVAKRLLIVKFGAIGDCIMAIPAAYAMHQQGYAVEWVCGKAVAPVLALYPWLTLHVVDERPLLRGSVSQRLAAMASLWRLLAGRSYDVCATLYYDGRYKLLTLPVRATRKFLLSKDDRAHALLPGRHHTDEYFRVLSNRPDGETPTQLSPIPPPSLPPNPHPRTEGKRRAILVSGGARNMLRDDVLRRWPIELYVELAGTLLAQNFEVLLAGGPDDTWTSPYFAHLPITDLTGRFSLVETISLFDSADVTITHDTGPLHLAGLTRTALLTIFGPVDPHGRLPHRPNSAALWGGEGFACRPCYDGRDYAPCTHNGCMTQITPAMVIQQIHQLLASPTPQPPRIILPSTTGLVTL